MGPVAEPVRSSELWGFFWSFFRPLRWMVVWVTLLALAQALTLVPIAFLVKEILDRYIPEADSSSVVLAGVSIFLLHTVYTLLALWNRHLTLQGSKRLMVRLREELVSRQIAGRNPAVRFPLRSVRASREEAPVRRKWEDGTDWTRNRGG